MFLVRLFDTSQKQTVQKPHLHITGGVEKKQKLSAKQKKRKEQLKEKLEKEKQRGELFKQLAYPQNTDFSFFVVFVIFALHQLQVKFL